MSTPDAFGIGTSNVAKANPSAWEMELMTPAPQLSGPTDAMDQLHENVVKRVKGCEPSRRLFNTPAREDRATSPLNGPTTPVAAAAHAQVLGSEDSGLGFFEHLTDEHTVETRMLGRSGFYSSASELLLSQIFDSGFCDEQENVVPPTDIAPRENLVGHSIQHIKPMQPRNPVLRGKEPRRPAKKATAKPKDIKCRHPSCGKLFSRISGANEHFKRVHGPQYKCPHCSTFLKNHKNNIQRHNKRMHPFAAGIVVP